mmetsp:Transcript_15456/g.31356  ORF Transcript_15456/g.31356 Transcript_15456/m.31356 type:complete len:346 (+) Transcript_15456:251-1288(+)
MLSLHLHLLLRLHSPSLATLPVRIGVGFSAPVFSSLSCPHLLLSSWGTVVLSSPFLGQRQEVLRLGLCAGGLWRTSALAEVLHLVVDHLFHSLFDVTTALVGFLHRVHLDVIEVEELDKARHPPLVDLPLPSLGHRLVVQAFVLHILLLEVHETDKAHSLTDVVVAEPLSLLRVQVHVRIVFNVHSGGGFQRGRTGDGGGRRNDDILCVIQLLFVRVLPFAQHTHCLAILRLFNLEEEDAAHHLTVDNRIRELGRELETFSSDFETQKLSTSEALHQRCPFDADLYVLRNRGDFVREVPNKALLRILLRADGHVTAARGTADALDAAHAEVDVDTHNGSVDGILR